MEHIRLYGDKSALFALSACALLGTLTLGSSAQAQEPGPPAPPPAEYAPPQQVYTVDVYEQTYQQPYQQPPPETQPARPRRVVVPYEDGMPVPEGGFVRSRSRKGLWIPGVAIFAASYFITGGIGSLTLEIMDDPDPLIWVPLAGPFLVSETSSARSVATLSMLLQGAGLTLLIAGLSARRHELVYYTERGRGLMFGAMPVRGGAMVSLNVL